MSRQLIPEAPSNRLLRQISEPDHTGCALGPYRGSTSHLTESAQGVSAPMRGLLESEIDIQLGFQAKASKRKKRLRHPMGEMRIIGCIDIPAKNFAVLVARLQYAGITMNAHHN